MRLAIIFLSPLVLSTAKAAALDAQQLQHEIEPEGGKAVINRYFTCNRAGEAAYNKIASGKSEWLALAVRLKKDSDACVSEDLSDAIARALPKAPSAVLALVDTDESLRAEKICVPFQSIEAPAAPQLRYLKRMRAVLKTVRDSQLQRQKERCLIQAEESERAIRRNLKSGAQRRLDRDLTFRCTLALCAGDLTR